MHKIVYYYIWSKIGGNVGTFFLIIRFFFGKLLQVAKQVDNLGLPESEVYDVATFNFAPHVAFSDSLFDG